MVSSKDGYGVIRIFLFFLMIGMSGCMHTYYTPNMHHAHLLKQKGEAAITAAFSAGEQVVSGEILGAYAVSDYLGVLINASQGGGKLTEQFKGSIKESINEEGTSRHLVEIWGGYFRPLGDKGVLEVYGGGGFGSIYNYYDTQETSYSTVKFNRFFVQPGIGKKGEYFDFAFSLRLATVHYQSIRPHNLIEPAWRDANALLLLDQDRLHWLYEPAFTIRGGNKFFKVQIQAGYSFKFGTKYIPQDNINSSIGIAFNILPDSFKSALTK